MVETKSKASIVECGFGVGKSFSALAYLAGKSERNLYGFDTFEGVPEPGPNASSPRSAKKRHWNVRTLQQANKQIPTLEISNLKF